MFSRRTGIPVAGAKMGDRTWGPASPRRTRVVTVSWKRDPRTEIDAGAAELSAALPRRRRKEC